MKLLPRFILLAALSLLYLSACSTRDAYRPVAARVPSTSVSDIPAAYLQTVPEYGTFKNDPKWHPPGRENLSLEKYSGSNFWLGHVEMTDYGTYQDVHQMEVLERAVGDDVRRANSIFSQGATILVFVHGWFNNAQEQNENLNSFRSLLSQTAAIEKAQSRGVIGIYLSWRGKSIMGPVSKYFSYWGRARVADKIGGGIMVDALARIKNLHWMIAETAAKEGRHGKSLDRIYQDCRLVLVGHSFGARALFRAVSGGMETNFLEPYRAARTFPDLASRKKGADGVTMPAVLGFGDSVLLINPAIEALPYDKIHNAMAENVTVNYSRKQAVLMMILSAQNDVPNKFLEPIGQDFGNRFADHFARKEDQEAAHQNLAAMGQWPGYHTHRLALENGQLRLRKDPEFFNHAVSAVDGVTLPHALPVKTLHNPDMNLNTIPSQPIIPDPDGAGLLPFMVVSTTKDIINGHSDFWPVTPPSPGPHCYEFVTSFIAAQNHAVAKVRGDKAVKHMENIQPVR